MTRDVQLNVRISDDERRMLRELAEHEHLSESAMLRVLIVREHRRALPPAARSADTGRSPDEVQG